MMPNALHRARRTPSCTFPWAKAMRRESECQYTSPAAARIPSAWDPSHGNPTFLRASPVRTSYYWGTYRHGRHLRSNVGGQGVPFGPPRSPTHLGPMTETDTCRKFVVPLPDVLKVASIWRHGNVAEIAQK